MSALLHEALQPYFFLRLFFLCTVEKDVGYTQNLLFIFELIGSISMLGLPKGFILFSLPPSRWKLYQNWEHICDNIVPVSSFSARRISLVKNNYFILYLFLFHFCHFFKWLEYCHLYIKISQNGSEKVPFYSALQWIFSFYASLFFCCPCFLFIDYFSSKLGRH